MASSYVSETKMPIDWFAEIRYKKGIPTASDLPNVNIQNEYKQNLLHAAVASRNNLATVELLKLGIDLNAQDSQGQTPLHFAIAHGNFELTQKLLECGADITILDVHGNSALWTAILSTHSKVAFVTLLCQYGAKRLANIKNVYGSSPLDAVLKRCNKELEVLLGPVSEPPPGMQPVYPIIGMNEHKEIPLVEDSMAVAKWIWKNLIPKRGQADSVQGELIRAIERLRWEAQSNGNCNWNEDFEMFKSFIAEQLCAEPAFDKKTKQSIRKDLRQLRETRPYLEDDVYDQLTGHVVAYSRLHPKLIGRNFDPALQR